MSIAKIFATAAIATMVMSGAPLVAQTAIEGDAMKEDAMSEDAMATDCSKEPADMIADCEAKAKAAMMEDEKMADDSMADDAMKEETPK